MEAFSSLWLSALFGLLGGMGLLLFGIHVIKESLHTVSDLRIRKSLKTLTKNRFMGLSLGATVTIMFQSSTATTVILVGLASAGLLSLKQTLPVILGTDIGTTVTAQLIAWQALDIALPIVGIGATIVFLSKNDSHRRTGQALLGFGLLFLGLKIMGDTMAPLRDEPAFTSLLLAKSQYPLLAMLVAAIFTFLVHSSAATVGIIMLFALQQLISLEGAIYLLFGANIGTTFTALLASIGAVREAQRVALAHFFFKVAGVLLFLPFVNQFAALMTMLTGSMANQVANVHTIFNVTIALLFLPFTNYFAHFLQKVLPDKDTRPLAARPRYLDRSIISYSPSVALDLAHKEIQRIYELVSDMTIRTHEIFGNNDRGLLNNILSNEDTVDALSKSTKDYLASILRQPLERDELKRCLCLANIVTDLEHIGDVIAVSIKHLAESKLQSGYEFSPDGWHELTAMHKDVCDLLAITRQVLETDNTQAVREAITLQHKLVQTERFLRQSHIQRLGEGISESEATSFIHMDLLNAYLKISEHIRNIALAVQDNLEATQEMVALESGTDKREDRTKTK